MDEYANMQCQTISMLVNFGLVFMVVVDAWGAHLEQEVWQHICNYLAFFLVIGIYWHSRQCVNQNLGNLGPILERKGFALVLHLILLALLLWSKSYSIYQSSIVEVDKAKQEI